MKYRQPCLVLTLLSLSLPLSLPRSLTVSPSRSQFLQGETLSLSCEDYGSSGGTIWRKTDRGKVTACNDDWGELMHAACKLDYTFPWDSGVYWCQSEHREHNTPVSIIVTDGNVTLESPALPVMGGGAVTLRCRARTTPPKLTADFYRNGSLISSGSAGEMRIPAVSKHDEGLYRCAISGLGESPHSWLAVTPTATSQAPPTAQAPPPVRLMDGWVRRLIVLIPYITSTALMLSVYRNAPGGIDPTVSMETAQPNRKCD